MLSLNVPDGAKEILDRLKNCGYDAYVVGGCVRDSLIGKEPKDWDICTNATPFEVEKCLAGLKIIETGIQHGTVTVMLESPYEVTTYRSKYKGNTNETCYGQTIEEDLSCRDFTINAMAWREGSFIDLFGGFYDLECGILRCVGDPDARLQEDALRILRAIRFASVYSMTIHPETDAALRRNAYLLGNISKERIRDELCKLIDGNDAFDVLREYKDVISCVIPEFKPCIGFIQNNPYHCHDVYNHILYALNAYEGNDLTIKLALLFHDIGKPKCYTEDERGGHFYCHGVASAEMADEILIRLKFDNATRNDVVELIKCHNEEIKPSKRVVRRWLNRIGEKQFQRLLDLRKADIMAHSEINKQKNLAECEETRKVLESVLDEAGCFTLKSLNISGKSIMALGVKEGPEIGRILNLLLQEVMDDQIPNDYQKLLERAKKEVA